MKRDRRLATAIALFVLSGMAAAWQALIVTAFINVTVMAGSDRTAWEHFTRTFGGKLPYGPNQACFDWCVPDLPFLAGWISIASVAIGVVLVVQAWWKPRA